MKRLFNKIDNTFESLFDVVCKNLNKEQTRDLLRDFHLRELPDVNSVSADLFFRPNIIPTNVLCVFYLPNGNVGKATINIGYPKYVPKFVSEFHRKQLLRKLDKFLDKRFGPGINYTTGNYWQSGDTIIIRNLKETNTVLASGGFYIGNTGLVPGDPYIGIQAFDTKVFSKEKALGRI
ncbi:MAG: hypothetical protein AAB486_02930 [Patescibacteria group bacterium]